LRKFEKTPEIVRKITEIINKNEKISLDENMIRE
jgi:hypothetical protein